MLALALNDSRVRETFELFTVLFIDRSQINAG